MRILQIHTRYRQAGGEDAVVAAEAELLRRAGHEVVQWQTANPMASGPAAVALVKSAWNRSAADTFATEIDGSFDVAHVHNTWYATSPSILPVLTERGIPIVMTLHNYRLTCANALLLRDGSPCELCVGAAPWSAVRYACYRRSRVESLLAARAIAVNRRKNVWADGVDRFLALTEFARATMVRSGLPEDKVVVKPNFVEDPGPRPAPPSTSRNVLFVGRLSREKGVATLIDAWDRARPAGLELTIAGDGDLADELRARGTPGVTFTGRIDGAEVRRLMLSSRALVFPSEWYEGMPITLLEAMAAGLPILASDLGSMTEMIEPLGAEWLVTAASVDAWATALAGLEQAAVDEAGVVARATWTTRYSPAVAVDALEAAYRF